MAAPVRLELTTHGLTGITKSKKRGFLLFQGRKTGNFSSFPQTFPDLKMLSSEFFYQNLLTNSKKSIKTAHVAGFSLISLFPWASPWHNQNDVPFRLSAFFGAARRQRRADQARVHLNPCLSPRRASARIYKRASWLRARAYFNY